MSLFSRKKDKKKADDSFVSSQIGAFTSINQAQATDETIKGMGMLREMASKLINVGAEKKQGNLFEIIEATKFNQDAAAKGIHNIRAYVTALEGEPHAAADIVIRNGEKVIQEVQTKSTNSAVSAARMFRESKYNGMQKVTNPEHADTVRRVTEQRAEMNGLYSQEHADTARNVRGGLELQDGSVASKGTSHPEAMRAAEHTNAYATTFELKQIGKEMLHSGGAAAVTGGVVGGAISLVKNSIAVSKGTMSYSEAAMEVAKDAGKSGIKSGSIGVVGAGIRAGASKIGIEALAKSNVATSIAAGVVESGITVFRYAKGEISGLEATEKIGQTGVSTASSMFAGAAAGAVFGPMGALVGSVAGYMVASGIYQSAMAILKDAKLAEEEAARVIALCEEAEAEMRRQREQFEAMVAERLRNNKREFAKCFKELDRCLQQGKFIDSVLALERFNGIFGHSLKLATFEEFDQHMRTSGRLEL